MKKDIILYGFISMILFSCGTRKVQKTEISDNKNIQISDNSTQSINEKNNILEIISTKQADEENSITKTITIEPLDNNKTAYYLDNSGNKKMLNNAKVVETQIISKKRNINEKKDNIQDKSTKQIEVKKKLNTIIKSDHSEIKKDTQRSGFANWWLILSLLLLLLVGFSYYKYRDIINRIV